VTDERPEPPPSAAAELSDLTLADILAAAAEGLSGVTARPGRRRDRREASARR